MALKWNAAEILESLPSSSRDNFDEIMTALNRKYAGEHKVEIYRMELSGRMQKTGESLEDFALQIERLVQLAYPGESHPLLEQIKIGAFRSGIRDPDIRCAVFATRQSSFAETVSFALAQETARIVSKPQICKLRGLEVDTADEVLTRNDLKAAIKEVLEQTSSSGKNITKCYNCGKVGHLKRNCKAPVRARSVSPPRRDRGVNQQLSQESPLN